MPARSTRQWGIRLYILSCLINFIWGIDSEISFIFLKSEWSSFSHWLSAGSDWRDGVIYLMSLKCSLSSSLVLFCFLLLFLWDLMTSWFFFFFYKKHLFNLITCTLKIESENGKMICARDCCRKCHLNSRWLGGEQRNSSRKPEKRLEKKIKRQCRKWGKECMRVGIHMQAETVTDWNGCYGSEMCIHMKEHLSCLSQNVACNVTEDTNKVIPEVLHYLPSVTILLPLFLVIFK